MTQYEKLNFVNGSPPALNAATLNHIEDGILAATEGVTALEEDVAVARGDYDNLNARFDSKADKATTLAGYGITDALSNANESVKTSNIADKSITLEKLAEEVIALLGSGGSGGGTGGITATQLAETLKNYVTASTHTSDLEKKEGVTNKVTSFDQNFVDTSNVKYPTVVALLNYLTDYYYDFSDIDGAFNGIRIDDNGDLIIMLPDGSEKNLGSVKGEKGDKGDTGATGADGSDYVLTDTDKTEIANIVINEYDSSVMAILGGDSSVTE